MNFINTYIKENRTVYFSTQQKKALKQFKHLLSHYKKQIASQGATPVFLCIGSDRATGDCYGPLVGDMLSKQFEHCPSFGTSPLVYGTLTAPVHALNLETVIYEIYSTCQNPFIIAIDASLGISGHIGYITLGKGPLLPGIGVQKNLPEVGELAITGIVNHARDDSKNILQSTRLSVVMNLATFTSKGILEAFAN